MGPIGCPETSVRIYHCTPRNIPEVHGSNLLEIWSRFDFSGWGYGPVPVFYEHGKETSDFIKGRVNLLTSWTTVKCSRISLLRDLSTQLPDASCLERFINMRFGRPNSATYHEANAWLYYLEIVFYCKVHPLQFSDLSLTTKECVICSYWCSSVTVYFFFLLFVPE
jgi:hypothetical protein